MTLHFEAFSSVETIDRKLWNDLAVSAAPMMEWEYFHALEKSGSVSPERGYRPCHLIAYLHKEPVAIAPLYERDRAWVEFGDGGLIEFLSEATGLPYHHGLVGTIPFTPVPCYQFLTRADVDSLKTSMQLLNYMDFMCQKRGLSTSRIYFVSRRSPELHAALARQGYICLRSEYSLWINGNYAFFDDYLKSFKSSRRTKIKRELRTIRDQGIHVRMVDAKEVPEQFYDDIHQLYMNTWVKHMGADIRPFLNEAFFRLLSLDFRHRNSFSVAYRGEEKLAMALFYHKLDCIYGRYWGCFEEVPFLHFATCYYHPIEYAIKKGIQVMDPGFGGDHKLIRGFEIVPIHHYIKFFGEPQRRLAHGILRQMQTGSPTARHDERAKDERQMDLA